MTAYWLYCRLGVHVGACDEALMAALDDYAEAHVTNGGKAAITDEHRAAIRKEHANARSLYSSVMSGI